MEDDNDVERCRPPCDDEGCNVTAYKEIEAYVPIEIEPYVNIGEPIVECIECPDNETYQYIGKRKGKCKFYIIQRMLVKIPVEFNVKVCHGDTLVSCNDEWDCNNECPDFEYDDCLKSNPCFDYLNQNFECNVKNGKIQYFDHNNDYDNQEDTNDFYYEKEKFEEYYFKEECPYINVFNDKLFKDLNYINNY